MGELNQNTKLAVAISHEHSQNSHLIIAHGGYYCFSKSEIIHDYALKFLLRKEFPYIKELNEFIQRTSASGLIEKWRLKNQYRFIHSIDTFAYLTFGHFFGIMILGFFLWTFLIVFLFIERYVFTKNQIANPSRFGVLTEMVIDPHRHFMLETKYL